MWDGSKSEGFVLKIKCEALPGEFSLGLYAGVQSVGLRLSSPMPDSNLKVDHVISMAYGGSKAVKFDSTGFSA